MAGSAACGQTLGGPSRLYGGRCAATPRRRDPASKRPPSHAAARPRRCAPTTAPPRPAPPCALWPTTSGGAWRRVPGFLRKAVGKLIIIISRAGAGAEARGRGLAAGTGWPGAPTAPPTPRPGQRLERTSAAGPEVSKRPIQPADPWPCRPRGRDPRPYHRALRSGDSPSSVAASGARSETEQPRAAERVFTLAALSDRLENPYKLLSKN